MYILTILYSNIYGLNVLFFTEQYRKKEGISSKRLDVEERTVHTYTPNCHISQSHFEKKRDL
jgi:hypothetical protein